MKGPKLSKTGPQKTFSQSVQEIEAVLKGEKPSDAQTKAAFRTVIRNLRSHVKAKNKENRETAKRLGVSGKISFNSIMKELKK